NRPSAEQRLALHRASPVIYKGLGRLLEIELPRTTPGERRHFEQHESYLDEPTHSLQQPKSSNRRQVRPTGSGNWPHFSFRSPLLPHGLSLRGLRMRGLVIWFHGVFQFGKGWKQSAAGYKPKL